MIYLGKVETLANILGHPEAVFSPLSVFSTLDIN